jgi:AraC-like DNA-binding protein/effector-binding domain-containing protein
MAASNTSGSRSEAPGACKKDQIAGSGVYYDRTAMAPNQDFLLLLNHITRCVSRGVTLEAVAQRAGESRFKVHRKFQRVSGETLKQFTLRLQLERAAAQLVADDAAVRAIALANGFRSHEVFVRAFRRYFDKSPMEYRKDALQNSTKAERRRHLKLTRSIGPCIRLFHRPLDKNLEPKSKTSMPTLSITRKQIEPQHILFIRRRIARSELQQTLGECFGKLFTHAAKNGLPIAGWPICRYASTGLGLWTVEPAIPLATPASSEGEMQADVLPGGWVALGIHAGPYDQLSDTNAAIERWIEANGFNASGSPREHYVTDPAEHPDSKDWRTEVYWPLSD